MAACSGASSDATGTGGSEPPPSTGGSPGGVVGATGGATVVSGTGGAAVSETGTGGRSIATTGGAPGAGGAPAGTGGATAGGGTTGVPVVIPPGTIPAGYPAPTADNAAKCTVTTMLSAGLCPGGGAGPVCYQCLFGGTTFNNAQTPNADGTAEAGNYVVTVKVSGTTSVAAESSRGLLPLVAVPAGQSATYAFVVNARPMEGQPNHAGGPGGYPGLDLFFSGPMASPPKIEGVGYALATAATKPVMVYVAGDSTVCDQTGNAFGGWAQMLPEFFNAPVGIANYANSGASSSSFGTFWNMIKAKWTAGDWVFIQFGHNDKGVPDATVQANLERMVTDALAANVTPIVVSPPARVQFAAGSNVDGNQDGLHAASAKAAAAAHNVAYIDLTALSTAWYNSLGSGAAALKFHANGSDPTHTNLAGAEKLAGLVVDAMKTQNVPLAKYLRQ